MFFVEIDGRVVDRSGNRHAAPSQIGMDVEGVITDFSFVEAAKKPAECTVTMAFGDQRNAGDLANIRKGMKMRVRWGYLGQLSPLHEMVVHSVAPTYDANGYKLQVVAKDRSSEMGQHKRQTVYANTQLGQAVAQIARHYGLAVDLPTDAKGATLDTTTPNMSRVKYRTVAGYPESVKVLKETVSLAEAGRSDKALLHWIAHRSGCEMVVQGKTLKFHPIPHQDPPTVILRWHHLDGMLLKFSVKAKEAGREGAPGRETKAAGIDPMTKKAFAFTAKDGNRPGFTPTGKSPVKVENIATNGRPVLGKTAPCAGNPESSSGREVRRISAKTGAETAAPSAAATPLHALGGAPLAGSGVGATLHTPGGKPEAAKAAAKATFDEGERGGIKASAETLGIPALVRRAVVDIQGVEQAQAGHWMVDAVTHKISGSGYVCTLELKRHGNNTKKNEKATKGRPNIGGPRDPAKPPVKVVLISAKTGAEVGRTTRTVQ